MKPRVAALLLGMGVPLALASACGAQEPPDLWAFPQRSGTHHAADGPGGQRVQPSGAVWYGWQPLLADAVALALVARGRNAGSDLTLVAGLTLFEASGPTFHAIHEQPGTAFGSAILRLAAPSALAILGASQSSAGWEEAGTNVGLGVGLLTAALVDDLGLSWKHNSDSNSLAPGPTASFDVQALPTGGCGTCVGVGFGGVF